MKDKLRLIFVPFVLTLLSLVIGYTFLHWLLVVELQLVFLKREDIEIIFPMTLSGLFAFAYLRPKFKILKFDRKERFERIFVCGLLSAGALLAPLVLAQKYMYSATGSLTKLTSIEQIDSVAPTKYYMIDSLFFDKTGRGQIATYHVSGRTNDTYNMVVYIAIPVFHGSKNSRRAKPDAWLGREFNKSISNRVSASEKQRVLNRFVRACHKYFDIVEPDEFEYYDRIGHSNTRNSLISAAQANPKYIPNDVILCGVSEPFERRSRHLLAWFVISLLVGPLVCFLWLKSVNIDEKQLQNIKEGRETE